MKICRKDALKELLKIVFGVITISMTNDNSIIYQGKWFSNCSYDDKSYEKYCKLFKLVLISDSLQVVDKNDQIISFDKSEAISNIVQYFEIYGISIAKLYRNSCDKMEFFEWLNDIFKENLLPAILISNKKNNKEEEDIKEKLQKAIDEIQNKINSRSFTSEMKYTPKQVLYDSDYESRNCNYGISCSGLVPSGISDKVMALHPIITFFCYPFASEANPNPYREFFEEQILEFNIENGKWEGIQEKYPIRNHYRALRLRLSKKMPEYGCLYNQEYIFATYLDEKQIFEYQCITPEDLKNIVFQRAKIRLNEEYNSKYQEYCQDVFEFVDDVLKRIFSLDFEKFVRFNDCGLNEIKAELQKVIVNFNQLYLVLRDYEEKYYRRQSYLVIQNIIFSAIRMLERQGKMFSREFNEQIKKSEKLKNHKRRIKTYCSANKLLKAIKIEEEMGKEHPCEYKNPTSIEDIYNYRLPGMLKKLKDTAEEYANSLKAK